MRREFIVCDPNKCNGCQICELACSAIKESVHDPQLSRIRNVRMTDTVMMSVSCRLCEKPACVTACPRLALSQEPETRLINIEKSLCDGCGWCIEACKFGAIALNRDTPRTVEICDLCYDLSQPRCVEFCPKDALTLSTPEQVGQLTRRDTLIDLITELAGVDHQ